MASIFHAADDVLRRAAWVTLPHRSPLALSRLLVCLILFSLAYGAAMGAYRGLTGESQWLLQMVYSAVKVPLLLLATFVISVPSFFVLNTLLGLRDDFAEALRAVVATQAGLAVILASLAPFTLFWYASSRGYQHALLFNGIMFAVASLGAQWLLRQFYRPLISRNRSHAYLLWGWLSVYTFVAIQMAWLLRPFIGAPARSIQFLRPDPWDNAYVYVANLVWRALGF